MLYVITDCYSVICYMSLFDFAIDMSARKKPIISDSVTAWKAKAYIYGIKEKRKLEAVTATNIYLEECMNPHTLTQSSSQYSITISITRALTVAFWLTIFVLYMYTVHDFLIK